MEKRTLCGTILVAATIPLSGLPAASTNTVARTPVAKWDFEATEVAAMKTTACAIVSEAGRGKCLKLVSSASRATVKTAAKLPDVASQKSPYTLMAWLKPEKSMISDESVEMAKLSVDGKLDRVYGRATVENGVLNLGANDGCVLHVKLTTGGFGCVSA